MLLHWLLLTNLITATEIKSKSPEHSSSLQQSTINSAIPATISAIIEVIIQDESKFIKDFNSLTKKEMIHHVAKKKLPYSILKRTLLSIDDLVPFYKQARREKYHLPSYRDQLLQFAKSDSLDDLKHSIEANYYRIGLDLVAELIEEAASPEAMHLVFSKFKGYLPAIPDHFGRFYAIFDLPFDWELQVPLFDEIKLSAPASFSVLPTAKRLYTARLETLAHTHFDTFIGLLNGNAIYCSRSWFTLCTTIDQVKVLMKECQDYSVSFKLIKEGLWFKVANLIIEMGQENKEAHYLIRGDFTPDLCECYHMFKYGLYKDCLNDAESVLSFIENDSTGLKFQVAASKLSLFDKPSLQARLILAVPSIAYKIQGITAETVEAMQAHLDQQPESWKIFLELYKKTKSKEQKAIPHLSQLKTLIVSQPASQSVLKTISQSVSYPLSQFPQSSQSISQSISQLTSQSIPDIVKLYHAKNIDQLQSGMNWLERNWKQPLMLDTKVPLKPFTDYQSCILFIESIYKEKEGKEAAALLKGCLKIPKEAVSMIKDFVFQSKKHLEKVVSIAGTKLNRELAYQASLKGNCEAFSVIARRTNIEKMPNCFDKEVLLCALKSRALSSQFLCSNLDSSIAALSAAHSDSLIALLYSHLSTCLSSNQKESIRQILKQGGHRRALALITGNAFVPQFLFDLESFDYNRNKIKSKIQKFKGKLPLKILDRALQALLLRGDYDLADTLFFQSIDNLKTASSGAAFLYIRTLAAFMMPVKALDEFSQELRFRGKFECLGYLKYRLAHQQEGESQSLFSRFVKDKLAFLRDDPGTLQANLKRLLKIDKKTPVCLDSRDIFSLSVQEWRSGKIQADSKDTAGTRFKQILLSQCQSQLRDKNEHNLGLVVAKMTELGESPCFDWETATLGITFFTAFRSVIFYSSVSLHSLQLLASSRTSFDIKSKNCPGKAIEQLRQAAIRIGSRDVVKAVRRGWGLPLSKWSLIVECRGKEIKVENEILVVPRHVTMSEIHSFLIKI